jgi:hypothetical protein
MPWVKSPNIAAPDWVAPGFTPSPQPAETMIDRAVDATEFGFARRPKL